MPRMDVGNAIGPAFNHMVKVLFRPFSAAKWLALGFASLLAVGGGGGGSGNFNIPGGGDHGGTGMPDFGHWIAHYWPFLVVAFLALLALGLLISWICSVFNFVYMDQVVRSSGAIREPFHRLRRFGTSLFLWRLGFGLIAALALAVLIAGPLLAAFLPGSGVPIAAKVIAVVWAIAVGLGFMFIMLVMEALANDFVSITMYARGVGILKAWGILLPILRRNIGQTILYFLLLIAFGLGAMMVSLMALMLVGFVLLIPFGSVALVAYLMATAAHVRMSAPVIAVIATYAMMAYLCLVYLVNCVTQPAIVFLQSFSLIVLGQADPSLVTIPMTSAPAPTEQ